MDRTAAARPPLLIADVEQATGVPRATLRIWERRYGFPCPARSETGERIYSADDLEKLRLMQGLVGHGRRPGGLVDMDVAALRQLAQEAATALPDGEDEPVLALLRAHAPGPVVAHMRQELARLGLERFVLERAAPWCEHVGQGWACGALRVFEEHLFTEVLQQVLRLAIGDLPPAAGGRRVLLATVSGEQHGLGLLMVQALLALERCDCVPLGVSVPVEEIADAARQTGSGVVALSFSAAVQPGRATRDIQALRARLPAGIDLWVGGGCSALRRLQAPGVRVVDGLGDLAAAVRA